MKKGVFLPLAVAIVAAVIYMLILSSNEKRFNQDAKLVRVIVAARDLPERKVLARGDITFIQIPNRFVQKDAFIYTKESDITKLENNLVTRISITKGNQISKSALTSLSPESGLSARVSPLWRGFVLTGVDPDVTRLIKPDDWVDIVLTFDAVTKAGVREKVSATILQRIKVLGVGNDLGQGMTAEQLRNAQAANAGSTAFSNSSAISLALDPRDVMFLVLARQEGDLTLVVRRCEDQGIHSMPIANLTELFRGQ